MKLVAAIFFFATGLVSASLYYANDSYIRALQYIVEHGETASVIGTAIAAGLIAIWGIFSQRAISRRSYTLTHLSDAEFDKDLIEAKKKVIEVIGEKDRLIKAADLPPGEKGDISEDAKALRIVLNDLELTAIGIERGVIDFEFYRLWYKTGTINLWDAVTPFVEELRRKHKNELLYHESESLVGWLRTKKKPKPKRGYIIAHWFW